MKTLSILLFFSLSATAGMFDAKKACESDVQKFCKDVKPGGGRIIQCLREHSADLSTECKEKGGSYVGQKSSENRSEEKKGAWEDACGEDVKNLCSDVKPGEGRIIECMKSKVDSLSPGCKAQMEKAKDRFQSK